MNHRKPVPPATGRRRLLTGGGALLLAAAAGSLLAAGSGDPDPQGDDRDDKGRPEASPSTSPAASGWMPGVARKPLERNFVAGERDAQRGLVLHVQEGEGSLYERFGTPGIKASAHFWVSQEGETEQYVSVLDRAWAQVEGNGSWASVETSGFATRALTEAQVDAVARIYAWGSGAHGWPAAVSERPDQPGLGTHAMGGVPWGAHACPGTLRAGQRTEIIRRMKEHLPATGY
ncbi:N-acetylmuramoyl-L-alanine amidase [Streptomyces sp. ISL-43]|uniref:peptidoglycan recognition protein family protein n=1 Tax=Streptomyces sp. ISL-43 TaxID=2819183 RepID=UPI001BEA47C1|nr:N-acetylmuramoyl-L-alanine amidase [Streptomyces sp. ISL-43]MBT2448903.1 N-acetylmuramoyl-L-alanine amidase [Streptomyces sp. ISL-43]